MSEPRKVDLEAVRTRRARIKREIELLRAEDQELAVAEAALIRLSELLATTTKGQSGQDASGGDPDEKARDELSPRIESEFAAGVAASPLLTATPTVPTVPMARLDVLANGPKNQVRPQAVSQTGWTRPTSQREYILMALDEAAETWLGSSEIQAFVHERWGVQLPTQSMRPLLTNMKQRGDIVRKGRLIASRRRALEDESSAVTATRARSASC